MDKYDYALLKIINSTNGGGGVGISTIDRIFVDYFNAEELQVAGLYGRLSARIEILLQNGLITKNETKKGNILTDKGLAELNHYRGST